MLYFDTYVAFLLENFTSRIVRCFGILIELRTSGSFTSYEQQNWTVNAFHLTPNKSGPLKVLPYSKQ